MATAQIQALPISRITAHIEIHHPRVGASLGRQLSIDQCSARGCHSPFEAALADKNRLTGRFPFFDGEQAERRSA
jgi:hypothetical protein